MKKRELIDTGRASPMSAATYGCFKESVDVGRSLSADKRWKAKNDAKPGEGDRGDDQEALRRGR
ncbi:hypothetical protein WGT02_35995 (plasmid) [Rhizobium sp. T1470]|uniref:Uncharacterized protein n=1 Tax=Rhizobium favelukesii TaxID=348824 RepID=W6RK06_9HYPH|nr:MULTISPECIES: hypothetical protein [Rhizobium]MCA0807185.1 hypothetical protein [Rhizobium sp. T1473]MCS0460293.1 hypothetical protein [Rhizobium favelukesii]UFS85394.1 hypothetical protein LPB79_37870 [Rhizobium sp. T136]CDM60650.1 hypothetical protein LPU83_pLPU83c_0088 [Rhizobium favelukesii]